MFKKFIFVVLSLLLSTSMAWQHPVVEFINVPNEFEMWIIRIILMLIPFLLALIGLICFCKKKKVKIIGIISVSVVITLGLISIVILSGQNVIRGREQQTTIDWGGNKITGKLGYVISNLFNFEKIDWNAITNQELNNHNIVRDVTKLYKKDIDRLLGTKDWQVIEKSNIEINDYKCIEWKIHFKDSNGREQEVVINNKYNPDELIISNDIIKSNKNTLDNLLGENNWTIKDEKFIYKPYSLYNNVNYKEWTMEYINSKNECREIILQNDMDFGKKIQSHVSDILTKEANILGVNHKVLLLPNEGPRTKDSSFNKLVTEYLDEIDKNKVVYLNLRELDLMNAIGKNGVNIIINEEKNEKIIEEILNKLKEYTHGKATIKFTFRPYVGYKCDEGVIIKSDSLDEKRYETKIDFSNRMRVDFSNIKNVDY